MNEKLWKALLRAKEKGSLLTCRTRSAESGITYLKGLKNDEEHIIRRLIKIPTEDGPTHLI